MTGKAASIRLGYLLEEADSADRRDRTEGSSIATLPWLLNGDARKTDLEHTDVRGLVYFWSLINDNPINADQLLGSQGYYLVETILNLLSFLCFCLAAHEATKGRAAPGG
jgi:hypothetical protein